MLVGDGEPIVLFEGRALTELDVVNDGDRPVQVGSHFHFAEANEALEFDRDGRRSGAVWRCPPAPACASSRASPCTVVLVDLAGERITAGFRGLYVGPVPREVRRERPTITLDRARYAALYGPTVGDRIRLADTDLLIEIEADLCGGPGLAGDEAVFGGGKVIRESMGQSVRTAAAGRARPGDHRARSSSTTGASSRPTSASATGASSRSARPATPTRWTASTPTW